MWNIARMNSSIALLSLLSSSYVSSYVPDAWYDFCSRHMYIYGRYCKDDLSRWGQCGGGWWSGPKMERDVKCPEGTRCSCYLGNDCDYLDGNILDKDICQPMEQAYPLENILHLKYELHGWEKLGPYENDTECNETGEIWQHAAHKSLMKIWTDHMKNETTYFKLIIPGGNGTFLKYYGEYPEQCEKTTISKFEEFGENIRYFHLKESKRVSVRFEEQVWQNLVYHHPGIIGTDTRWTIISDSLKKTIRPVRFYDSYVGSQEEQCCDREMYITYENVPLENSSETEIDTDPWFEIPDFCP